MGTLNMEDQVQQTSDVTTSVMYMTSKWQGKYRDSSGIYMVVETRTVPTQGPNKTEAIEAIALVPLTMALGP